MVDTIQQAGGYVTMDDMKYAMDNYPITSEALTGSYNGYDILTVSKGMPEPPTWVKGWKKPSFD